MARNNSVERFKRLCERLPRELQDEISDDVHDAAHSLRNSIMVAAPKGEDGKHELAESVRVEPGRHPLRFIVRAGGPLTTKTVGVGGTGFFSAFAAGFKAGISGKSGEVDYALPNEFGTKNMAEQPFFYPTARSRKPKLRTDLMKKISKKLKRLWDNG